MYVYAFKTYTRARARTIRIATNTKPCHQRQRQPLHDHQHHHYPILQALINDWRHRFSTDGSSSLAFPFLFVQLAPYHSDRTPGIGGSPCQIEGGSDGTFIPAGMKTPNSFGGNLPQQRLVQLDALSLENVGMACTVDVGDSSSPYWPGSVHPRHKQQVGARLALEARRIAYDETDLVSRGPQVAFIELLPSDAPGSGSYHGKAVQIVRVHWNSVGGGLVVPLGGHSSVAFLATLNNTWTVPGTLLPTNLTASSCDVYFNIGYSWSLAEPNCTACVPHVVKIDYLPFDFPVASLFNDRGLPAEPFTINITGAVPPSPSPPPTEWHAGG